MNTHAPLAATISLLLATASAQADTLVNIQGYGPDGAGTLSPLSYPLPAGTVIDLVRPVLLTLPAGSYSLVDAWGLPGALYDTWNFQVPEPGSWRSHYVLAEQLPDGRFSVLVDGLSIGEPTCQYHFCAWGTRAEATAAFLATPAYHFTLSRATTVGFVTADYFLPDNDGGISLLLSAVPVPEPAPALLWVLALPALALRWRSLRRAAGAAGSAG